MPFIAMSAHMHEPHKVDTYKCAGNDVAVRFHNNAASYLTITDTPERLADMLRFALDEITALFPADTPPPAEPVPYFRRPVPFDIGDEADIDTVTEADWDDVLTDRFGGEAA